MEWILHHDNASSHRTIIIREFLTKDETNTIRQPSNSPDMAIFFCSIESKNHYEKRVLIV